jgi:hypothetical protein
MGGGFCTGLVCVYLNLSLLICRIPGCRCLSTPRSFDNV